MSSFSLNLFRSWFYPNNSQSKPPAAGKPATQNRAAQAERPIEPLVVPSEIDEGIAKGDVAKVRAGINKVQDPRQMERIVWEYAKEVVQRGDLDIGRVLMNAVKNEAVQKQIAAQIDEKGHSLLYYAYYSGNIQLVDELMILLAKPGTKGFGFRSDFWHAIETPLSFCVRKQDISMAAFISEQNPDTINIADVAGRTPLLRAACMQNRQLLNLFAERLGDPALIDAVNRDDYEAIKVLARKMRISKESLDMQG